MAKLLVTHTHLNNNTDTVRLNIHTNYIRTHYNNNIPMYSKNYPASSPREMILATKMFVVFYKRGIEFSKYFTMAHDIQTLSPPSYPIHA